MRLSRIIEILRAGACLGLATLIGGCVLAPRGMQEEQTRLAAAGRSYEPPRDERQLPELPLEPEWHDILQRAFLANGELEAAYFEWKAALERVGIAAAYPNTNVTLGYEYLFSGGNMKAWDRSTVSVGFDPMQNLSFPTKVLAAGRVAFEEARAAGERFAAAKFALQRSVLNVYLDYALLAETIRLQHEQVALLQLAVEAATSRLHAGASQELLLRAELDLELAKNSLRTLEAEAAPLRSSLNASMGRPGDSPLPLPQALPVPRAARLDPAQLLAIGVGRSPELTALAAQVAGRENAVDLARQQYIPDINPFAGTTGSMEQMAGAILSIPLTLPKVRAGIAEARALLRASEARWQQLRLDQSAALIAALSGLRNRDREVALLQRQVLPAMQRLSANVREKYQVGLAELADLVEAERAVLDLRLLIAEARTAREKYVADAETVAGVDIETLEMPDEERIEASPAANAEWRPGS